MSRVYRTVQGDAYDKIARLAYGSEKRAMDIARANPRHLSTVVFSAGVELVIPDLPETIDERTPPWLRD